MNDINEKILRTLQEEVRVDQPSEDQLTIFGMLWRSFRGPFRWMAAVVVLLVIIFSGLALYCGYMMLNAPSVDLRINWLAGLIIAFVVVVVLRLWFFMEMNRLSVLREIKRLELQVSLLSNRLSDVKGK